MYCPKCGTENPDEVRYCGNCGAAFGASPATAAPIMPQTSVIPKTSGLAIAALVLGILSFFLGVLTGIPAIILGIIALVKIEKSGGRSTGKGFAIAGIIVPVFSFALMMVILIPALSRVRNQAKAITCRANLRQWSIGYTLYCDDNNGSFIPDENWLEPLQPYGIDKNILLCPMATKSKGQEAGTTFTAWKTPGGDIGSYGINGWMINPNQNSNRLQGPIENYWRNIRVGNPSYIPLMMDARQMIAYPLETDPPPQTEDPSLQSTGHMQRFCIDRHDGYINMAFMDGHVEEIGLKKLWIQKWHRTYNTEGPWTQKGGVKPTDWPPWMMSFRDF